MLDSKLSLWDFIAIAFYFVAIIATGIYAMFKSNRSTVNGYFLAGRFMTWLPVGASLFASNIGSEHFIGLAGSGAAAGIAVGAFELNSCFLLQILGWIFLPVYIASQVCTLPEYMQRRFGGHRIRAYLAILSLFLYIFTKISVNLYSGALFIQQALYWNIYFSVVLILIVTAITTVTGGLTAVIYTDTVQAFVMIAGASLLAIISFIKVGGYKALYTGYLHAIPNITYSGLNNETCGLPNEDAWYMLRSLTSRDMPWLGFILGQTPTSIWYWCADQMMVQRTLASASLSHAQGATLFAGFLKILPIFIIVMPGMISRVLFTDEIACVDPDICFNVCGNRMGCTNIAYPKLILELMPSGLKGIMLSVMLAAIMSDLTSIFNSASTLFTMDLYRLARPKANNQELIIIGRLFVCLMVIIGVLWIPIIQGMQGAQIYIYIQAVSAYLAPPIACVYLLAILWKRANEQGSFWALIVGLIIGLVRMILDFSYKSPPCGHQDNRPVILSHLHYMYFALILFLITAIVDITISLLTIPPTINQIKKNTYWTRFDEDTEEVIILGNQTMDESSDLNNNAVYPLIELNHKIIDSDNIEDLSEKQKNLQIGKTQLSDLDLEKEDTSKFLCIRKTLNWFCGVKTLKTVSDEVTKEKINKLASLHRTHSNLLFIFLIILLSLATFCYIFFSFGSDFGLLRNEL